MITADIKNGKAVMNGDLPAFLGEYIIISKLIIDQIEANFPDKEAATKVMEGISKIIGNKDDVMSGEIANIMKETMELLNEQI